MPGSAPPFGLPRPVQASHPAVAAKSPLLPWVTSRSAAACAYRAGLMKPAYLPWMALMRVISAAHSGATALVPPITVSVPSIRTA